MDWAPKPSTSLCFLLQDSECWERGQWLTVEGVCEMRSHQDDTWCAISKTTLENCGSGARCWGDRHQPRHPQGVMFCVSLPAGMSTEMASWHAFISTVYVRGPQLPGQELVLVCGLLGTGPHSRKWEAGERASEASSVFTAVPHSLYPPGLWKNCLPQNWSLVPKRLGTTVLNRWSNFYLFIIYTHTHTYVYSFSDPFSLCYHKMLNIVPCAAQ